MVKLALAIGTQSEGAVHSHVGRGLDEGIDPETLQYAAVLAMTTACFPKAMAAMTWIEGRPAFKFSTDPEGCRERLRRERRE